MNWQVEGAIYYINVSGDRPGRIGRLVNPKPSLGVRCPLDLREDHMRRAPFAARGPPLGLDLVVRFVVGHQMPPIRYHYDVHALARQEANAPDPGAVISLARIESPPVVSSSISDLITCGVRHLWWRPQPAARSGFGRSVRGRSSRTIPSGQPKFAPFGRLSARVSSPLRGRPAVCGPWRQLRHFAVRARGGG
jgi:hypothetical protein